LLVETTNPHLPSDWQKTILEALAALLQLPEDPDAGWRAKRPTTKAYKAAVDLVSEVPVRALPLPRVAPGRRGGIQFEWEKGSYALEIGILPNGTFEVLKVTPSSETESQASFTSARESIMWFARV
jgi:hypothetical protein